MSALIARSFAVAALTLASLLPATPASAAPAIDAKGAAELKTMVDDTLGFYTELGQRLGEGLTLGGDVTVTPKGAFYEVTIPAATMTNAAGIVNLDTVVINATPQDDGDYRASIALPPQITITTPDGQQVMKIELGKQKFSGIFHPALGAFTTAEMAYEDVIATITADNSVTATAHPVVITLGSVVSRIAMKPDGKLWSGPQTTQISKAVMTFGEKAANRFSFDELKGTVTYDKIDMAIGKRLRDQIRAAMEKNPAGEQAAFEKDVVRLVGNVQAIPENVTSVFSLSNIALELAAQNTAAAAAQPLFLRIASLDSKAQAHNLTGDAGKATTAFRLNGFSVNGHDGPLSGLIPAEIVLNATADKLPFKSILATLETASNAILDAVETATPAQAEQQAEDTMNQATASLMPLLAKAGSTLSITDSYARSADLSTALHGTLAAHAQSPYGFAGNLTLSLTGMDELIDKLQNIATTTNDPAAAGYAQFLIIMKLSGQYAKNAEGISQRNYAVEVTPEGQLMLNGVDIKSLVVKQ